MTRRLLQALAGARRGGSGGADIVLGWMSRATRLCRRGDLVHVARPGGDCDLKYDRCCDRLAVARDRRLFDRLAPRCAASPG